jgi:hypothetical protein
MGRDLAKAPTWRDRLRYMFGPPGWSHDGSKQTVAQLRGSPRAPLMVAAPEEAQPAPPSLPL